VWIPSEEDEEIKKVCVGGELEMKLPRCPPEPVNNVARTPSSPPTSPSINEQHSDLDVEPTPSIRQTQLAPQSMSHPSPPPVPDNKSLSMPPSPPYPQGAGRYEDFSSPWYVTTIGYTIVTIMLAANVYVVVQLALGGE